MRIGEAATGSRAVPFLRSLPLDTRVVVRRKENDGFHDALGDLVSIDGETCTVHTRKGPVEVPLALVTRVRTVPPPPPPRQRPPR